MVGLGQPLYAYCPPVAINSVPFHSQNALVLTIKGSGRAGGSDAVPGEQGLQGTALGADFTRGSPSAVGVASPVQTPVTPPALPGSYGHWMSLAESSASLGCRINSVV